MTAIYDVPIYERKLHCGIFIFDDGHIFVRTVPGGWIYEYLDDYDPEDLESGKVISAVFVPFHNEFQTKENN